ncbi:MAG TPA: hypothetical protein VGH10_02365 [Actinomycetota bacterium]|jgi:hypothetical protein
MLPSGTSSYRIDDMVRRADAHHLGRATAHARTKQRHGRVRRLATMAASIAVWPVKR